MRAKYTVLLPAPAEPLARRRAGGAGATMRHLAFFAACEATLGAALWIAPSLVLRLLLGAEASGTALVLGRFAGIAWLSLALACWPARETSAAGLQSEAHSSTTRSRPCSSSTSASERIGWGRCFGRPPSLHAALTAACLVALRQRMGSAE